MTARDELIAVVLPVLEKCFESDWNMTYSEMVADALIADGVRKVFDGDCGLSNIKDPDEREAAEAWMRWANIVSGNDGNSIAAMQQMLTEFGYRKPRTITTTEEVDALPNKAVALTQFGDAVTIYRSRRIPAKCYHFLTAEGRTATVIHEPGTP